MIERNYTKPVIEDLKRKMVFISGPRQVGKTTLAREIIVQKGGSYFNWDDRDDQKKILTGSWPLGGGVIVLDEIHKYPRWKNLIKGHFDKLGATHHFIVTGSARLNIYRRGGDSLQGRYHYHRLHPFSVAEIEGHNKLPSPFEQLQISGHDFNTTCSHLLRYGGYPEPFTSANEKALRRWHKEHFDRVVFEDVRDLSNIHDITNVSLFASLLDQRTGSPFSINSVREDLQVSHRAATGWFLILQNLYYCYTLSPFSLKLQRSLSKEPKMYLWDWSQIHDEGACFENFVAGHLLKFCHALEDREGHNARLWYLRDREKREVDFLVTIDSKPWFCVECKLSEPNSTHIPYFRERLSIPFSYCVCRDLKDPFKRDGITYTKPGAFLHALGV
jgi:predicted AAA+ superfamily ATPase